MSDISVVIPAYNCADSIDKAIEGVYSQDVGSIECIVVDDGSTDNTAEIIKSFKNVKYVYQDNSGPAVARNVGAQKATSDVIFFTDSDCVPEKQWLKRAMTHFSDPKVAVVAGSYGIANEDQLLARCIHKEILFRHHHLMPENPKAFGSYNFGVRKNVFEQVGGFNSQYRFASGEDNDLSYKIVKEGYKIFFDPKSLVKHFHTEDWWRYLKEQFRHGFWRFKMYLDHPQMTKGDDYTFWKDIVEVPLAACTMLCAFLSLFSSNLFMPFTYIFLSILFGIQVGFSFFVMKSFFEGIYYSFILTLRAFARTLGFTTGAVNFFLININK